MPFIVELGDPISFLAMNGTLYCKYSVGFKYSYKKYLKHWNIRVCYYNVPFEHRFHVGSQHELSGRQPAALAVAIPVL